MAEPFRKLEFLQEPKRQFSEKLNRKFCLESPTANRITNMWEAMKQ
jgi:hypothetical protein